MIRWLDQPVYSYPWYSNTGGSFYSQPYSETHSRLIKSIIQLPAPGLQGDSEQSRQIRYYRKGSICSLLWCRGGTAILSVYFHCPYKTGDLWIQEQIIGQYVVCPVGTWLQLVANVPAGGSAGFYEVVQTDATTTEYMVYQFSAGYNSMNYLADQVGRHMLYFVQNSQPSNVVVVDVFSQAQGSPGSTGITT